MAFSEYGYLLVATQHVPLGTCTTGNTNVHIMDLPFVHLCPTMIHFTFVLKIS